MTTQKKIVKDDINFLEYPNWVINNKDKSTTLTIQKDKGKYEILSPHGLPKQFDKIVMYYLLYKLYKKSNFNSGVVETTRYEIAKNIFNSNHFGKNVYTRIMNSLEKWHAVSIKFEGVFYEGDNYSVKYLHVVDHVTFEKSTGLLNIKFNAIYMKQLKDSKFYKLIDFEQYKKLQRASSARLYEILTKNFKERKQWAVGIQNLAEKMTFEKRVGANAYYPSDVLRHLKPSVNEINKKTDMVIEFIYNSKTKTCIFTQHDKVKEKFVPAKKEDSKNKKAAQKEIDKEVKVYYAHFQSLSEEDQEQIVSGIDRDTFLKYVPNNEMKIYAYMKKNGYMQS